MVPQKRERVARLPQALSFIKEHCLIAIRALQTIQKSYPNRQFTKHYFAKSVVSSGESADDAAAARDAVACLRLVGRGRLTSQNNVFCSVDS